MNTRLTQYARPAAIVAGIMGIVGFISIMLFFGLEAPQASVNEQGFYFWGFISDISAPLTMLPLLVVILALHEIERTHAPTLSRSAFVIGLIGALGVTSLQILLIIKILTFQQEVGPVVLADGILGVWLILANYLAWSQRILPSRLAWLGIAVGVSMALYPILLQALGGADFYSNVGSDYVLMTITSVIVLVSYLGLPIWAFGFARAWSSGQVKEKAEAAYAS